MVTIKEKYQVTIVGMISGQHYIYENGTITLIRLKISPKTSYVLHAAAWKVLQVTAHFPGSVQL